MCDSMQCYRFGIGRVIDDRGLDIKSMARMGLQCILSQTGKTQSVATLLQRKRIHFFPIMSYNLRITVS